MPQHQQYERMKRQAIAGWNTWNTRSILSHVLMPEGFAVNLCLKDYVTSAYMREADVGNSGPGDAVVFPGAHAYDGAYTQLRLQWKGIEIQVESAAAGDDLVLLVRRLRAPAKAPLIIAETGMLWNRPGLVLGRGRAVEARLENRTVTLFTTGRVIEEPYVPAMSPYLAVELEERVGFSTGKERTLEEIGAIVGQNRARHRQAREKYGPHGEAYNAMQTCLAWDTIYEPLKDRIVSPVSRRWNKYWSGYVLFCWDNYFAACMTSLDSREIAYSNLIEMTAEKTPAGFVPNFASALGASSRDRSQPPVGSLALKEVYRKYREKWLVELLFDDLYGWNSWYFDNRQLSPGLLAWGSNPFEPVVGHYSEIDGVNDTFGAALESGLDNSPMYDDMPFDKERHLMLLADAGLTGLYIMDCRALAELAELIGRTEEAGVLRDRRARCEEGLERLWHREDGFFYNRLEGGQWSKRISPTNFYALFSSRLTEEQARRVVEEHFYNPDEFWGDYILPSIGRSDPAYPEQEYWRGRIWAPMNFLAYLALKSAGQHRAAADLAQRSEALILKEWLEKGHVHENYCADTGAGCNKPSSDGFYHWGGLLAYIALIEAGQAEDPTKPL